jgi:lysophospholipase L1-like esterase
MGALFLAVQRANGVRAGEPGAGASTRYYLALGDSLTFGYQNSKFVAEQRTNGYDPASFSTGFVDDLGERLRRLNPALQTVNYGCPDESTRSFLSGGCPFHPGHPLHDDYPVTTSQHDAALAFLAAHPGQVDLITITLGANDVQDDYQPCLRQPDLRSCLVQGFPSVLSQVRRNLDAILADLQAVAPSTPIIVVDLYDPLAIAEPATVPAVMLLNSTMQLVAAARGAQVADVFAPFNRGPQPATLCRLTLYCMPDQDIHPSDEGYQAMADQVWAALYWQ